MLALILFAVVVEDVDESAGAAVEDMEVLTTLDEAAVAAKALAAAALRAACIFLASSELTSPVRRPDGDPSSAKYRDR
jgi:hypothetical protein